MPLSACLYQGRLNGRCRVVTCRSPNSFVLQECNNYGRSCHAICTTEFSQFPPFCSQRRTVGAIVISVLAAFIFSPRTIGEIRNGSDMMKLEMPPPLSIDWKMKDISTAETHSGELDDGRLELRVKHDILHGVTPAMLVWWFQHIDGSMTYRGKEIPHVPYLAPARSHSSAYSQTGTQRRARF